MSQDTGDRRPPSSRVPLAGELLTGDHRPFAAVSADPLRDPSPAGPLEEHVNRIALSLGELRNRLRIRAELSQEALALYKHGVVERMRLQADVLLHAGGLHASAQKKLAFERFLSGQTELIKRLADGLERTVDFMKNAEFDASLRAEEEAERRKAEIDQRLQAGRIDAAAARRLRKTIEDQRRYKVDAALLRCDEFLGELQKQMAQTIRELEIHARQRPS